MTIVRQTVLAIVEVSRWRSESNAYPGAEITGVVV